MKIRNSYLIYSLFYSSLGLAIAQNNQSITNKILNLNTLVNISKANPLEALNNELKKNKFAIVKFHLRTCGPCKRMSSVFEQVAPYYTNKIKFIDVSIEDYPTLATHYEIRSAPTILYFKDGKKTESHTGSINSIEFQQRIKKIFNIA